MTTATPEAPPQAGTADFPQITWDTSPTCERGDRCLSDGQAPAAARALWKFPHTCAHSTVQCVCDPCAVALQLAIAFPFSRLMECPRCHGEHICLALAHVTVVPL